MILADTTVVSEFMTAQTHPGVAAWATGVPPGDLVVSAITVQEIEFGIGRLDADARRSRLQSSWQNLLAGFASRVIDYDQVAAQATASILVAARSEGRGMSVTDAQVAGTCVARHLTLATRNVKDFAGVVGLTIVNPFGEGDSAGARG